MCLRLRPFPFTVPLEAGEPFGVLYSAATGKNTCRRADLVGGVRAEGGRRTRLGHDDELLAR